MRHQTTGLQNIEFLVKQVSERLKKIIEIFKTVSPKSGCSHLQEVVIYKRVQLLVICLGKYWCFGKVVTDGR